MKLDEYIKKARTTALYPNLGSNMYYPTLGLAGECAEVLQKILYTDNKDEIVKECGDVLWYVANLSIELGITIDPDKPTLSSHNIGIQTMVEFNVIHAGTICECIKKTMRDDNNTMRDDRLKKIEHALYTIIYNISGIAFLLDTTLSNIMETNIDKLFSRKERGVLKGDGDNR